MSKNVKLSLAAIGAQASRLRVSSVLTNRGRDAHAPFRPSYFLFTLSLIHLVYLMTTLTTSAAWEQLPSLPEETGNFASGVIQGDLITLGGIVWKNDTKLWINTIRRYDTAKKSWSEIGKLPHALAYPAFGQTEKGIYFVGGGDGTNANSALYFCEANLPVKKLGQIPQPLLYSGAAIAGNKLFIACGVSDVADIKTLTNSFYAIDLANGKTEALPEFPAGKWILPSISAVGNKLFAFTGASLNPTDNTKVVNSDAAFVYSIAGKTWKPIKAYPLAVRGLASCALDDRHILLGGGYENDFRGDTFIYDTKSDSYFPTVDLPYRGMSNFIKAGEFIYWLGGEDKMKHRSNLCYRIAWKELLKSQYPRSTTPDAAR